MSFDSIPSTAIYYKQIVQDNKIPPPVRLIKTIGHCVMTYEHVTKH